jgi:hypothetical protein
MATCRLGASCSRTGPQAVEAIELLLYYIWGFYSHKHLVQDCAVLGCDAV